MIKCHKWESGARLRQILGGKKWLWLLRYWLRRIVLIPNVELQLQLTQVLLVHPKSIHQRKKVFRPPAGGEQARSKPTTTE